MAIVNLLPNAEGTVQQWTPFPAPLVHWNKVDDPVGSPDEDVTYVYTGVLNDIEDFNHQAFPLAEATITNVRLFTRTKRVAFAFPDSASITLGLRIAGIRYECAAWLMVQSVYTDAVWDWANNPAPPGNPWTKANIDALQSSIKLVQVAGCNVRCTQVYLIITYIPRPVAGKGLVSWTP